MLKNTGITLSEQEFEGFPNIKAMFVPRKIEGNCIYFFSKGRFKNEGIMLTGTMEVLQDDKTKQEIWRTGDTMYYKQGVTDPDYCVLKFTAIRGRYYCDLKTESFNIEDLK